MRVHGYGYRQAGMALGVDDDRMCPVCGRSYAGSIGVRSHLLMAHGYAKADAARVAGTASDPRPSRSGIYFFRHPVSGRIYIGQAVDLDGRLVSHLAGLEARRHANPLLQLDYELLQEQGMTFEWGILVECPQHDLDSEEKKFIEAFDALGTGYNLARVGRRGTIHAKRAQVQDAQFELAALWSGVPRDRVERLGECLREALRQSAPFDDAQSAELRSDLLVSVARRCGTTPKGAAAFYNAAWSLNLFQIRDLGESAQYAMLMNPSRRRGEAEGA